MSQLQTISIFSVLPPLMKTPSVIKYYWHWRWSKGSRDHDVDVDVERVYELRPKPLCPPHLITSQYYFCYDSSYKNWLRLPVPCNCALKLYIISWLYQNLSSLVLNVLVVLADTTQFGKLFHVFTTLLVKPNFCRSYFTWDFSSLRSERLPFRSSNDILGMEGVACVLKRNAKIFGVGVAEKGV